MRKFILCIKYFRNALRTVQSPDDYTASSPSLVILERVGTQKGPGTSQRQVRSMNSQIIVVICFLLTTKLKDA